MTMTTDHSRIAYSELRRLAGLRAVIRSLADIPAETMAAFARVRNAHETQAQLRRLPDEALRDLDMSCEEISGLRAYQPDLPFFMQMRDGDRS